MKKVSLVILAIVATIFISCKKENKVEPVNPTPVQPTSKGVYILNEGSFTSATSSLSYYDIETKTVTNNMFFNANNAPIGDVGQSLTLIGDDLYIVVNNSKYIYKVDANTVAYKAKLENFDSPRYMLPINENKAYVSDMVSPCVWIVDLNSFSINGFIDTGKSTEAMVKVGNEVFVTNWSRYYYPAPNNTVQIIDCENDRYLGEIEVTPEPVAMVVDKNDHIWVICSGGYEGKKAPALFCIDPATRVILKRFDFDADAGDYPSGLAINGAGDVLYYMNGTYSALNVYKMSIDATEIPENQFITSESRVFYNIKVDPNNGDIYVTDAKNYVENGSVERFASDGTQLDSFTVGILPSFMLFK